jgi:acetoin utilization protein AcuC
LSDRSILINHPDFAAYNFGPEHPLRPERLLAGLGLLQAANLYSPERDTPSVTAATRAELELVHTPSYIDAVTNAGLGESSAAVDARFGLHSLDNPPFPAMHEASALVTGGTVLGARAIMRGEVTHAFNPAGGLHHALRDRASGFCIYNDPAVAAAVIASEFNARVFYVDFDCHHGDGVQWIFYHDPNIFTLSFHESGRYLFPGTGAPDEIGEGDGKGACANLPFAPFTEDASWQEAVNALFPPLLERFNPDILISNHGCDTHEWDPLTHLSLSTRSLAWQARLSHHMAHHHASGRWLAVGSGGYDWRRVVPRSWALLWAEMTEQILPDQLPSTWLSQWDTDPYRPLPHLFIDPDTFPEPGPRRHETEDINRAATRRSRQLAGLV